MTVLLSGTSLTVPTILSRNHRRLTVSSLKALLLVILVNATITEQLRDSLENFVSYRTVSSSVNHAEDCRRGASYLRSLFKRFGAQTEMLTTEDRYNPIVCATFKGMSTESGTKKRILFYGHYDVIAAENEQQQWSIPDPFAMKGQDGYLYGRGVSDNKGPILAALYAVADLVSAQALTSDVVFLIEGEEECGSRGFAQAVRKHKHIIGDIDWVLLANSYWLTDDVPCLTYGLRGVIHATLEVKSDRPDLHSGVDGSGLTDESLKDLVMLLATLSGRHGRIEIPGFYDPILPLTGVEQARYAAIVETLLQQNPALGDPAVLQASLLARWREPSLTIHRFSVSGPENLTIIPSSARVSISLRLVPNQQVGEVRARLINFLQDSFNRLGSQNKLSITIDHQAEPWLGDPDNELFQTLEKAIIDVWSSATAAHDELAPSNGSLTPVQKPRPKAKTISQHKAQPPTTSDLLTVASARLTNGTTDNATHSPLPSSSAAMVKKRHPLYIREGGSIPAIRFLEKEFGAPAAHLPCGQASDGAHLDNERLRLTNLYNSREIFGRVFRELGTK